MRTVYINTAAIESHATFHRVFRRAMGFPDSYGANMDAWIDCMSSIDDPTAGLSEIAVAPGELLVLEVSESLDLAYRCPDIWQDLLECCAFVNQQRTDRGNPAVLCLLLR
ncbi:MAG: barstar family protein [Bacteroidota bacterium]